MFLRRFTASSPVSGSLYIATHVGHGQEYLCGCTFQVWNRLKVAVHTYSHVPHHSSTSLHVLTDVPHISEAPVLMLRPRAWNMVEHNMMVVYHLYFTSLSLLSRCRFGSKSAVEVVESGGNKPMVWTAELQCVMLMYLRFEAVMCGVLKFHFGDSQWSYQKRQCVIVKFFYKQKHLLSE